MIVASDITRLLYDRFSSNNIEYRLANAFIFRWESDFFVKQRNGYCYEIEIKISRSDFFADFKKKEKHEILQTGGYKWISKDYKTNIETENFREIKFRPNKLFYCVPEGLIKANEIPKYAGLMYARERDIIIVKNAPIIHREVIKAEMRLCNKFYNYWMEERQKHALLKNEFELYKNRVANNALTGTELNLGE